ncbi:protein containing Six-hairpin glycosidase-like domain protein [Patescibacteria group bacterium]|nr:protein containing Six-hairpin glycosidase-like domain protein [Patescibacteria group bacterium]
MYIIWLILPLFLYCGANARDYEAGTIAVKAVIFAGNLSDYGFIDLSSQNDVPGSSYSEFSKWLESDLSDQKEALSAIRTALATGESLGIVPTMDSLINPNTLVVAVTLFQPGTDNLRWIVERDNIQDALEAIVAALRKKEHLKDFDISDPDKCRIMLEIVTDQYPLDIKKINNGYNLGQNRFEPGITGIKLEHEGNTYYYMPTEANVNSHLGISHALNHFSKKVGIAIKTNKISERIALLKELDGKWQMMESFSFITYGDDVLPLFRGYPQPAPLSKTIAEEASKEAVNWIYNNMNSEGKFLYYYDGVNDNFKDHEHPGREDDDRYYNILRHCGGIFALLKYYETEPDKKYPDAADKALDYLMKQIKERTIDGEKAYYIFYNKKSKLGGSGLALVTITKYYKASGDDKYNKYAKGLARHIVSQINEKGVMQGYYIHPMYNNSEPLIDLTPEENQMLYSPYYPGESLMGLALFDRYMNEDEELRKEMRSSSLKAIEYLITEQPKLIESKYNDLPNDSWLMQAIHEWWFLPEFQKKKYSDYVFDSAKQLMKHQYTEKNSPYYDYVGGFYYFDGEHVYPDGARGEGLIDAHFLAKEIGDNKTAAELLHGSKELARNLLQARVTKESAFLYPNPNLSIGAFRFKLTRHWLRVDVAQHNGVFFMGLARAM